LSDKLIANDTPVNRNPDWDQYINNIRSKYENVDAKDIVTTYRIKFYSQIGDWKNWAKYQDEKIRNMEFKQGDGFWELNLPAWKAFLQCNDDEVLEKALQWSDISIKTDDPYPNFQCLDTKANLLYKLGRVQNAIEQEQKSIELVKETEKRNGRSLAQFINDYLTVIEKMKKGDPTYVEEGAVWDSTTLQRISKK
jgi:hypothetical protein